MRLLFHYFSHAKGKFLTLFCAIAVILTSIIVIWQTTFTNAFSQRILVVLDAGHSTGANPGVVAGYYEGNQMWVLASYEKTYLEQYGFDVILTRSADTNPGLTSRGLMAVQNAAGYDVVIFMSDHSNAATSPQTCGVVACTSKYLSSENTNFINYMMDAVANEMKKTTGITYNRGEIQTKDLDGAPAYDWYGVIRGSVNSATSAAQAQQGPVQYSFIMEHGFHTNYTECSYLNNNENLKNLAAAKAKAFADYFNKNTGATASAPTTSSSSNSLTGYVVKVPTNDSLNVRSSANPLVANNIITTINNGSKVTILNSVTSTDNHPWMQIRLSNGTVGYVNAYYIQSKNYETFVGRIQSNSRVYVETAAGSGVVLSSWPYLSNTNLVDVIGEEVSSSNIAYYKIRIAGQFIGYVPTSTIVPN